MNPSILHHGKGGLPNYKLFQIQLVIWQSKYLCFTINDIQFSANVQVWWIRNGCKYLNYCL